MSRETPSLTSLPSAPDVDRRARMVSYSISMGLRIVCLFLCFVVPGWWRIIPIVGVIVLPLVGVALANVANPNRAQAHRGIEKNAPSITSLRL